MARLRGGAEAPREPQGPLADQFAPFLPGTSGESMGVGPTLSSFITEVNAKFPIRAQKFPAVFTVNINWSLVSVCGHRLRSHPIRSL